MRLEVQRKSDLALRALRALEAAGATLNAQELAERLGSTPQFLPQVMRPLVRAGWVDSESGPHGGYRLAEPLGGRSMLELIELVEGPVDDGRCVLRGGPCDGTEECALHAAWIEARKALIDRLAELSVSMRAT